MSLAKYKKPDLVTFEVDGEKFIIDLPTRWNRVFTRHWQQAMTANATVNDEGKIQIDKSNPSAMLDAQQEGFVKYCIIESPLSEEQLLGEYLPLCEALFNAANRLADEEEARADALVGKLSDGLHGSGNGKDKMNSTKNSKGKGELHPAI